MQGVLLIGGSASVGKTTVAETLAKRWALETLIHLDGLRSEIAGIVDHLTSPEVWDRRPQQLLELLLEMTGSLRPYLIDLVSDLLTAARAAIVEGEGIEPAVLAAFEGQGQVQAVYIVEDDPAVLAKTFSTRPSSGRFKALNATRQMAVVEMNRLYGAYLTNAAAGRSHPCVASRPWPTLAERVHAAGCVG